MLNFPVISTTRDLVILAIRYLDKFNLGLRE